MGIRFLCPNGHKLNVKEFQAGRKGICPYCGAKTQIPTHSTRKSSRQEKAESRAARRAGATAESAGEEEDELFMVPEEPAGDVGGKENERHRPGNALSGTVSPADSAPLGPFPSAPKAPPRPASPSPTSTSMSPGSPAAASDDPFADVFGTEAVSAAGAITPSAVSGPLAGGPAVGDPLSEAGDVTWYVRPPSGGQFGPADRTVMQAWLTEGRVSPDCLVWREGWRDWQQAADVFPQLGGGLAAVGLGALLETELPAMGTISRSFHPTPRRLSRHKQAILVVVLLVAFIILLAVFLWVFLS